MVGRCISYWTVPFLGDILVFSGVFLVSEYDLVCCEFMFVISVCILSASLQKNTTQIMELEAAVKKYDKTGHVLEEEDEEDQMLLWKYQVTIVSICCSLRSRFLAFLYHVIFDFLEPTEHYWSRMSRRRHAQGWPVGSGEWLWLKVIEPRNGWLGGGLKHVLFSPLFGEDYPFWLFFKGVETTNQMMIGISKMPKSAVP